MSKLVIHKAPKPPPAPPAPKPWTVLETAIQCALVGCVLLGMATLARTIAGPPSPPPGWDCWRIEKYTTAGRQQAADCFPARGWHAEHWPGVDGPVSVPNRARRYSVRDR